MIPLSEGPWLSLSMNFVTDHLSSNSKKPILVVPDYLAKMTLFILCNKTIIGEKIVKFFLVNITAFMDFQMILF